MKPSKTIRAPPLASWCQPEALTIANALEYEAAEKQVLEHQAPEVRQALRDAIDEVARGDESNSMRKKLLDFNAVDFRPFRGQTLEAVRFPGRRAGGG